MSIRRLDPDTNMSGLPLMVPADDGGYVDYDDHEAEVERLQARERDLEAALIPLYDAGHDVLRRVGGDPDAPGHMEMLHALAVALQDACRLAVVSAEKEDGDGR